MNSAAKNPAIATTILRQLGGTGRLGAMVGAHHFHDVGNGLEFKIKGSRTTNIVKIVLAPDDTYTVTLRKFSFRTLKDKNTREFDGIYVENLKGLIEDETGLYLSL